MLFRSVGVHTTQFAIRDPRIGLYEPVLKLAAGAVAEFERASRKRIVKVAGLCGVTAQAVREAAMARAAAEFFAARFARPCRFRGAEGPVALLSDASAAAALMGPPGVSTARLMALVAEWVGAGGASLDKPTHFEVADGKF